jgi:type IV pilus assembly protein PilB
VSGHGITSRRGHVPARKRVGELLVEAGVIDGDQLQAVLAHQRKWGGRVGQCVVALGFASEAQVVRALASRLDCPVADLSALRPGPELAAALALVPPEVALRHKLIPIAVEASCLTVAMADPTNVVAADDLSFRVGRRVRVAIAGETEIARAVRRLYHGEEDAAGTPGAGAGAPPSSPRQAELLAALDIVAHGEESPLFERGRLVAALAALLVRKGLVADVEILAEMES